MHAETHHMMRLALRVARGSLAGSGGSLRTIGDLDHAIVEYIRGHALDDLEAQRRSLHAAAAIVPALRTAVLTWEAQAVVAGARRLLGGA